MAKRKSNVRCEVKKSPKQLKASLWIYCRMLIRNKYGNECYTCGQKNLDKHNWHTGHFIAKKTCGAYLKYDLRNLRPQCYNCNINLGGNGALFYQKMVIREGQEYVDQIFRDRNLITKEKELFPMLIEKYKLMAEEL